MSVEGRGSAPPPSEDKIEKKPFLSWESLDYDVLLTKLGEFGNFQRKALLWLWLPAFVGGIVSIFQRSEKHQHHFEHQQTSKLCNYQSHV